MEMIRKMNDYMMISSSYWSNGIPTDEQWPADEVVCPPLLGCARSFPGSLSAPCLIQVSSEPRDPLMDGLQRLSACPSICFAEMHATVN